MSMQDDTMGELNLPPWIIPETLTILGEVPATAERKAAREVTLEIGPFDASERKLEGWRKHEIEPTLQWNLLHHQWYHRSGWRIQRAGQLREK